jgi:hypothetical protein
MFKNYFSKPTIRNAHKITDTDRITALDDSTSMLQAENMLGVAFKHHEPVNLGDYIIYLNDKDVYHCNAKVFADRNIVNGINRVSHEHIEKLKNTVQYKFERVGETTVTGCWAFLPNGFQIAYGESACVDPNNFDFELGKKYAKERAMQNAENKLWELEGYLLKMTGSITQL